MLRQEKHLYAFGPFQVDSANRFLLRDGKPLPLTPKAFDILLLLVENHGQVMEKERIMQTVWPDTFVEEANLTQHISTLRKVLGESPDQHDFIETIPRRGYRFVAPVNIVSPVPDVLVVHERTRATVVVEEELSPAPAALPAPRYRKTILLSGFAVLLVALVVGYLWISSRAALPFVQRDWILILDFENQTGDARFDRALLTALTASLEQSRHANVYSRARLAGVLKRMGKPADVAVSEPLGVEVAEREGIRAIVACSITRAGQQYALTARLIDPRRQLTVNSFTERALSENDILDALESLARSLRRNLGESFYSISQANRPLPRVTTSSLDALRAYSDAGAAWRRGKYDEGLAGWRRAVELDPEFALAHAELGSALASHVVTRLADARAHFEKALAFAGRTTEREHLLIQARFHSAMGHNDDALRIYDAYLQTWPDDIHAQFNRTSELLRAKRWAEAVPGFEQVLRIDSSNASAVINIATCYRGLGKFSDALRHYDRAFQLEPSWVVLGNLNHEYGFTLVGAGNLAKARQVLSLGLEKPDSRFRALRSLALLDLYQGQYRAAAAKLREAILVESKPELALNRAREHLFLSIVREGQGNRSEDWRELDEAHKSLCAAQPTVWLLLRIGAVYARVGAPDKAATLLKQARPLVDLKNNEHLSDLHLLEGELEFARGNSARALEILRLAERENSWPPTLECLARALAASGNSSEAIAAYEKFLSTPGWLGWEPQQSWFAAHLALARLHLARGDKEKALKLLDSFLTLWNDANPDLPLLRSARQLLAATR